MITLIQALREMDKKDDHNQPIPFDLQCCTFSRSRGEGGKIINYQAATLCMLPDKSKKEPQAQSKQAVRMGRQPAHFINKTRNIKTAGGDTRKVWIRSITMFNGEKVVY